MATHGNRTGTVSVWAGDLTGVPFRDEASAAPHYAASTMKLPLLVAAHRLHERGELDLDQPVAVHNEFASALDDTPYSLEQADDQDDETWAALGGTRTLRALARASVVRSGNLATNLVLEHVGAGAVGDVLRDAGCTSTTVLPRGIGDAAAREAGIDNVVTAADLGMVMAALADGRLAEAETSRALEAVLADQQHRDKIPAGLPADTYVANKTGWVDGVAHDVALVRPAGAAPYVLAVCTTTELSDEAASRLIAEVSRAIWEERTG
ncbi:MAG: serine hydrolase [Actinomycetota bacterium]